MFNSLDIDGSGRLGKGEINNIALRFHSPQVRTALKVHMECNPNTTDVDFETFCRIVAGNQHVMSELEFSNAELKDGMCSCLCGVDTVTSKSFAKVIFDCINRNNDDLLDIAELGYVLSQYSLLQSDIMAILAPYQA